MPNVTLYAILGLVAVLALAGAGAKGYSLGKDNVRAEYAARDLQAAADAQAAYKAIAEKYRAKEQADAQALATVANDYERRLKDARGKTTVAMDALRSGALRLRDPGAVGQQAGGNCAPETPPSTGKRDGEKGAGLSDQASEFLLTEAARADAYTEQLAACQAVIEADRK